MNEPNKPTWGGKRPGSGRKKEKVRMERPFVKPETEKEIRRQMKRKKLRFGELLDTKFNTEKGK